MGPFRTVKYSPIFYSNLAVLVRANTVQLRRAETGLSEGWNGLLIELFFFCLNCAQMALRGAESDFELQVWTGPLGLKEIFLIFSVRFRGGLVWDSFKKPESIDLERASFITESKY